MSSLFSLVLTGNKLSGTIPSTLAAIPSLQYLCVRRPRAACALRIIYPPRRARAGTFPATS